MDRLGGFSAGGWRLKSGPPAVFQHVPRNLLEGMEDVQGGAIRAGTPGVHGGRDEHTGGGQGVRDAPGHGPQAAQVLGTSGVPSQASAAKIEAGPVSRGDRRDLEQDRGLPKKQRHTAKRIYERLRTQYGFGGKYTIVKDYVREHRRRTREMYVPLTHPPGHAQCDFGQARGVIGGVERAIHYFVLDLAHSDGCFVKAYPAETTEAFCDGRVAAFSFLGGVPRSILYDDIRLASAVRW